MHEPNLITAEKDLLDYLKACYDTLAISMSVVLALFTFYRVALSDVYSGFHLWSLLANCTLGFSVVFVIACFMLSKTSATIVDVQRSISSSLRYLVRPFVMVGFLILLGLMISLTGGARNSGFSSILLIAGSVAIIFAKKNWSKVVIFTTTIVIYMITSVICYVNPLVDNLLIFDLSNSGFKGFLTNFAFSVPEGWDNAEFDKKLDFLIDIFCVIAAAYAAYYTSKRISLRLDVPK